MEYNPKDNEVIHLLKKLKDSNGAYPPELLALRRQGYLKQVAQISAGAGLVVGLKNIVKGGKGSAGLSSSAAGTVVEALLVAALVAEAGAVTYFYRDKVAEYMQLITRTPKVEHVASPPVVPSPFMEMQIQITPSLSEEAVTITVTGTESLTPGTPSGTPSPALPTGTTQPNGRNGTAVQSASTSAPGSSSGNTGGSSGSGSSQDPKGNNGNHYGQTPKPERTKDNGSNDSNNNQSSSTKESSKNKNKP
jgi:hypothetical protein